MAAIVSGRRSLGCGLVKRTRPMPSTAPTARSRSAKSGRRLREVPAVGVHVLAEQRDLDHARGRASAPTSATMSSRGRLTSGPRTEGTMQKAQELSQPVWMVTHAAYGSSRTARGRRAAGRRPARVGRVEDLHRRAPRSRARRSSAGARPGCGCRRRRRREPPFSWIRSRSFWARQPPTAICRPGLASHQLLQAARGARRAGCRRSPGCSRC